MHNVANTTTQGLGSLSFIEMKTISNQPINFAVS